jgi:AraC-like DNA-binding protein
MSGVELQSEWIERLPAGQFRHLFDHLPGTLFFAKNCQGKLMGGNPAFVRRCGFHDEHQILGLSDHDIFPPLLAEKYFRDDMKVIRSGKPLLGLIELFPNSGGQPEWFITDKLPLFDREGKVSGLCGTVRSYEEQRAAIQPYLELAAVAEHLKENYRESLDLRELAKMAGSSERQLERKFRATFQTTPRHYLIKMRVVNACRLLMDPRLSLTEIALEVGFYDHSDFSRQFKKHMGESPTQYREANRGPKAG